MGGLADQFGLSLLVALLVAAGVGIVAIVVGVRLQSTQQRVVVVSRILAAGSVLIILAATALPRTWPPRWEGFGDPALIPGRGGLSDLEVLMDWPWSLAAVLLVANVTLYALLGCFGTLGWPNRLWNVAVAGLGLSLSVELWQFLALDRVASTDDVLLNLAGTALGIAMTTLVGRTNLNRSRSQPADS